MEKLRKIKVRYTPEELQTIVRLFDEGKTAKEIAKATGRTVSAIYSLKLRKGKSPAPANRDKVREMTPREMIKALYDMGYRIEGNKLVLVMRKEVKLSDIING